MNTRSAPSSASLDLLAALLQRRAPDLRPRARAQPARQLPPDLDLRPALAVFSACASVLTEMNSTPSRSSSIIRFTALPPPPPTPTTFIRAFCVTWLVVLEAMLERSLDATAATLGEDGEAYRSLMAPFVTDWDRLSATRWRRSASRTRRCCWRASGC
jgi:hypothetical protein